MNIAVNSAFFNYASYLNKDNVYSTMKQARSNALDEAKENNDFNAIYMESKRQQMIRPIEQGSFNPYSSEGTKSLTAMMLEFQQELKKDKITTPSIVEYARESYHAQG